MSLDASLPYLHISYDGRRRLLAGEWKRTVMPFELQRGYYALLEAAAYYQCPYWLIDTTNRHSVISPSDVFWMLDTFFPELPVRLGGVTYLAYLMAPNQLAGVLATPAIPTLPTSDNQPYYLQRFTDLDVARQWLRQCAKRHK